ncbi:hypothetical protein L6452_05821 [Arctium lappa]|uniref:Uncharacterized protein n=1 Tax=Arctium lappa TaxID=4217 RepID=A0ACB9EHH8_ARCLA|nr:hypothetical protein L6452_05821 [Arctium lappa]
MGTLGLQEPGVESRTVPSWAALEPNSHESQEDIRPGLGVVCARGSKGLIRDLGSWEILKKKSSLGEYRSQGGYPSRCRSCLCVTFPPGRTWVVLLPRDRKRCRGGGADFWVARTLSGISRLFCHGNSRL